MAEWAERAWAMGVSVAMLSAVAWPAVRGTDGFPLSNYPMFSQPKDPVARVFHVVGHSQRGDHRPLPPEALGTDEIMQAFQTVKLAIRSQSAAELCERVARTIHRDPAYDDLDRLEVRTDSFDTVAYWFGDRRPRHTEVAAACPVVREPAS